MAPVSTLKGPAASARESGGVAELESKGEPAAQMSDGRAGSHDDGAVSRVKTSAGPTERILYLEAIRGLAAFQVLLLHTFSAFAPAIVFSRAPGGIPGLFHFSPLFAAYDGYSAVYLFFVLSGFVLTPLFGRFADKPFALAASRWVRLAAPALVAALAALAVKIAVGAAPVQAGRVIGSGWLSGNWRPPGGVGYFLYDALIQAPVTGYSETSFLAGLGIPLGFHPLQNAYVAPFWTLSVEMQGSVLIIALSMIARYSKLLWWPIFLIFSAVLFRTDFACFLVGHALAKCNAQAALRRTPDAVRLGLATVGVSLCVIQELGFVALMTSCRAQRLAWIPCSSNSLKMMGAILVFVAAIGSPGLARILDRRPFVALGRLSFSLYLIHWPIVLGVGSVIFIAVGRGEDIFLARAIAVAAAVCLSLVCAEMFSPVDAWAVAASRRLRGGARAARPHPKAAAAQRA
jgi:peptidoglycan/LPS O-acetylase OafA/YrhL